MAEVAYAAGEEIVPTPEQLAAWTIGGQTGKDYASGRCPKCDHEFGMPIVLDVVSETGEIEATVEPVPGPTERATRRFTCACLVSHEKRPDGAAGCGRWWLASMVARGGGGYGLIPATDRSITAAAVALEAAAKDETTRIRTWGEKWLPAVAAIYGLFGLAGIVVSKDSVKDLPSLGLVAVVGLAGISLFLIALAVFNGYVAAFGWLKLQSVANDAELATWYTNRRKAITAAPDTMLGAIRLALGAVLTLFIAVGLIWAWPSDKPSKATVEIAYNDGGDPLKPASACGLLQSSEDGKFVVQTVIGGTKEPKTIDAAWVTKVTAKDSCS